MKEFYKDQAIHSTAMHDRVITSFYTPEGIRRMDTLLSNRIRAFKRGESFPQKDWRGNIEWVWKDTRKSLKKDIEENPHLHSKIKTNLLYNLNH